MKILSDKDELLERAIEAAEEQTGQPLDEHGHGLVSSIVDEIWSMFETDEDDDDPTEWTDGLA